MTYWNLKQVAPQQTKHHTHTHTCRGTITTPTRPITHSCTSLPLLPVSVYRNIFTPFFRFTAVYFLLPVFFPFSFLFGSVLGLSVCLSVFLAFLWVSGPGPQVLHSFLRFSQQFLLYDFILSSFYAFFMLDVAVFSLCWPTNPPSAHSTKYPSSRVPDPKTQFSTVQFSLSLYLSPSLTPLNKWITTRPVRFSSLLVADRVFIIYALFSRNDNYRLLGSFMSPE